MTPTALDYVVKTCLAKDPDDRWQSARDVGRQVQGIVEGGSQSSVSVPVPAAIGRQGWRQAVPWVAAIALAVVGVGVWTLTRQAPASLARLIFSVGSPNPLFISQDGSDVAISPDGTHIVYLTGEGTRGPQASTQLQVRALDSCQATTVVDEGQPYRPFFSPDGESLGFLDLADRTLKRVSVRGGPTSDIGRLPDDSFGILGATWGADDNVVFAARFSSEGHEGRGLWQVRAGGGEPAQLTTGDHAWPEMLPGGQGVLLTILVPSPDGDTQLAWVSLEGGEPTLFNVRGSHPRYAPTGHLVYGFDGTLYAVRFDPRRMEVIGTPTPAVEGVITKLRGAASFDVAQNGTLVSIPGAPVRNYEHTLWWVGPDRAPELAESGVPRWVCLS